MYYTYVCMYVIRMFVCLFVCMYIMRMCVCVCVCRRVGVWLCRPPLGPRTAELHTMNQTHTYVRAYTHTLSLSIFAHTRARTHTLSPTASAYTPTHPHAQSALSSLSHRRQLFPDRSPSPHSNVIACVCVCACVCVSASAWEREGQRETEGEHPETPTHPNTPVLQKICPWMPRACSRRLCVCVCVCERERERERESQVFWKVSTMEPYNICQFNRTLKTCIFENFTPECTLGNVWP